MAKFNIKCIHKDTLEKIEVTYNTNNSEFRINNWPIKNPEVEVDIVPKEDTFTKGSSTIKKLKIQMGLACNYDCGYCSQASGRAAEINIKTEKDIDEFISKLSNLTFPEDGEGLRIEFWGGEPLVYWKILKPLVEKLKIKFPKAIKTTITNGALFDKENLEYLLDNDFGIAMSHDGPGQKYRGPDPFENPKYTESVLDGIKKLIEKGSFSFNSVLHKHNFSRKDIVEYFNNIVGIPVTIGEGGLIDYRGNGDNEALCLSTKKEHFEFRKYSLNEFLNEDLRHFDKSKRPNDFIESIMKSATINSVGQKCGMDTPENIAINMSGDVITCQNVSTLDISANNQPHKGGNITNISEVEFNSSKMWQNRPGCINCPVIHLCSGGCMFQHGEEFFHSCEHFYSEHIIYLVLGIIKLTNGFVPVYIDSDTPLPDHRRDIWGDILEHKEVPKRKIIPIKEI